MLFVMLTGSREFLGRYPLSPIVTIVIEVENGSPKNERKLIFERPIFYLIDCGRKEEDWTDGIDVKHVCMCMCTYMPFSMTAPIRGLHLGGQHLEPHSSLIQHNGVLFW